MVYLSFVYIIIYYICDLIMNIYVWIRFLRLRFRLLNEKVFDC